MTHSSIIRRIESELCFPGLSEALGGLRSSDLKSLLLDVYRKRSERAGVPSLPDNLLLQPSTVDARRFAEFDRAAFEAASAFDAIELSPVNSFGASFALGGQSQNNVLSTIRNAEVVADPTIALAIEAAARRRQGRQTVRLCASHRCIRLQPVDVPGFSPHFRLFAMVSAGSEQGSYGFERTELRTHIAAYLSLFDRLNEFDFSLAEPLIELADMRSIERQLLEQGVTRDDIRSNIRSHWFGGTERFLTERGIKLDDTSPFLEELVKELAVWHSHARFQVNSKRLEGLGYYSRFALRISLLAPDGNRYPVADGGFTDWTARLQSNRKERLLISGVGSEFLCKVYAR